MKFSDYLKASDPVKTWDEYCGFLDLSLDEFMAMQEKLLLEQIDTLYNSPFGKRLLQGKKPESVDDFRKTVPFTTYEDYADVLLNRKIDQLPTKPTTWIMTTWRGGDKNMKYAPVSEEMLREHTKALIAALLLSTSKKRYHFNIKEHDKFLYGMAPMPYLTGLAPHALEHEISFDYLPSIEAAESMSFKERNKEGFKLALNKGVDLFFGLSSVLVKIGEDFTNGAQTTKKIHVKPETFKMKRKLLKLFVLKKVLKKKVYPKSIFDFNGIICAGTDSKAFKDRIESLFGIKPLEIFGGTEIATVAVESWSRKGLTFFPDVNFLEFIPEEESHRSYLDPTYTPSTVLLNEILPGEKYELVTTKFKGGVFVRYRVGDMVECVALDDQEYGIHLPQIRFVDRISNVIDLAGFTRLTESLIDEALKQSKIKYNDWVVRKEYRDLEPKLHLYIELTDQAQDLDRIKDDFNQSLKTLDDDYASIEALLGRNPLEVTVLKRDTIKQFEQKYDQKILKFNASQAAMNKIIALQY